MDLVGRLRPLGIKSTGNPRSVLQRAPAVILRPERMRDFVALLALEAAIRFVALRREFPLLQNVDGPHSLATDSTPD